MRRLARSLESSLAANTLSTQQLASRRQYFDSLPNLIKRYVGLGVENLAANHRATAEATLSGMARLICGLAYLGNGYNASVYSDGDSVLKAYRHTYGMSTAERQAFADRQLSMHQALAAVMGQIVTPQTFSIGEHPLGTHQAVLGHQPFVAGTGFDIYALATGRFNHETVFRYCERQPTAQAQLRDLVEGTFTSHDANRLVPDLIGTDNFRLVGPQESLALIDSDPVHREEIWVYDQVLRQAELLGDFVGAA